MFSAAAGSTTQTRAVISNRPNSSSLETDDSPSITVDAACGKRMTSSPTPSAVLLDPHPLWLDAIEVVVGRVGMKVVGKTTSGSEALRMVDDRSPDLLTVEIDPLPGEPSGLEVLRQARSSAADLRVIVLSAQHDSSSIDSALAAGASAYVVKTAHRDDIASTVRQAFDHSVFIPGAAPAPTPAPAGAPVEVERPRGLTRRELEILKLMAEGHSNVQLARMLWVTEQTVKFHLSNIYRKLDVANRTQAARWAQNSGLLRDQLPIA
jgi:DNA-binding NarL/FixJ family response regulator